MDSWDRIVEDNQNYIFRLAFHLAGNIHEAEDVTQEALMRAFEHRETFRGDASMRTWLSRIAVNVYLASRKRSSRVKAAGVAGEEGSFAATTDYLDSPESLVIRGEFMRCIHYLLQHGCRPSERVILVMRDLNGMRYDEIARVLGITLSAVKTRLHRARRAMRDLLLESGCSGLVRGGRCTCEEMLDL